MFTCPNCRNRLTVCRNEFGTYWSCSKCGGRAVGMAVLHRVLAPEFIKQLWIPALEGQGRPGRNCPACDRPMAEVAISSAPGAMKLDVCQRCQFVWFDPGEFETAPPAPPGTPQPGELREKDLPQAAREALAIYKVGRIAEQARAENPAPDEVWKTIPAIFCLPVELDATPLQHLPLVTWSLAAAIVLVSCWGFTDLANIVNQFGLIPAEVWRYGGLTLVTSFFLHAGYWHLIGNLYFFILFGNHVEDYLGRRRFALLLAASTLTGGILHVLAQAGSDVPCIGASGGISGIIVFYALEFPHAKLGFLVWSYYRTGWVQFPAWLALVMWLTLQVALVVVQLSGFGNIAAFAHLGGAAAGFLLWFTWRKMAANPNPAPLVQKI
jgi:membrane associated rhomboid family serine protease/Zn-finger nucleic acid-binding protein